MNELARKKKKGFTLIELIAVIAIIGILAAVLVPRVLGYLNDAKISKVVAQCRSVVMAQETIRGKQPTIADDTIDTVGEVKTEAAAYPDHVDVASLDMISGDNITIALCKEVANGKKTPKLSNGIWTGGIEGESTPGTGASGS